MKKHMPVVHTVSVVCAAFLAFSSVLSGCSGAGGSASSEIPSLAADAPHRETRTDFPVPEASGTLVAAENGASIDYSNASDGYVMISFTGEAEKIKVQIASPDEVVYTYNLTPGAYETFPLSAGSGAYQVSVLKEVKGTMYAMIFSCGFSAEITDEFSPFLYPNQYVQYEKPEKAANALGLARTISDNSTNDLNFLTNVYHYVIGNITYDAEKMADIPTDYLPVIDETLASGKGICFDYASLMTAMLRSQGIPTKLVVGYSGTAYHAWISVYLSETGWVDKIIEFNGSEWSLMDPTLASNKNNKTADVGAYIGDGSHYTVKYCY